MSSALRGERRQSAEISSLIAGRYVVERALGKGGTAQVFCVTDRTRGGQVALKQLPSDAGASQLSQFELEFQTLASLRHPHIVRAIEFGRDAGGVFYTMELLRGADLRERAPSPWPEVCAYLRDAARALALLHARRLVHRDVSPRNLWRTPEGHVKLIDFGAIAPFGSSPNLIGTPPYVPAEALLGQALDQRADLYSLGAVAYYLLTREHAYPARSLDELHELWREAPMLPSAVVAALGHADLPPVPLELDQLVKSLLSRSPAERPSNGAEVLDRLDALRGARRSPSLASHEAHARLVSPAFVGRQIPRRRLRRLLALAAHGRGQSCLVEAEPGAGRSRLLRELAIEAQIALAAVVHVEATSSATRFGVASALSLALLDALPAAARVAAAPFADMLADVSPAVRQRLDAAPPPLRADQRVAVQSALRDWFVQVASTQTLVVLVDGLELVDEDSLAFLLGLADRCAGSRLLLVCSAVRLSAPLVRAASARRDERIVFDAERLLRETARSVVLEPLSRSDALELLRSVFGETENLDRLALRLHDATHGNPGHMLELCSSWVRRDVIGLADGTWILPQEIPTNLLSDSRAQALRRRLDLLGGPARELARALSVHSETTPLELVDALANAAAAGSHADLSQLLDLEIVERDEAGIRFTHAELRCVLLDELSPAKRQHAQLALGEFLLSRADGASLARLGAGVHLLAGGDDARAVPNIVQALLQIAMHEPDNLRLAAPLAEAALALLRERGRPVRELVTPLGLLAIAGYFVDRAYALNHGQAAIAALEELLDLPSASKLARYVGKKLGVLGTLAAAGVRLAKYKRDQRVPTLEQALFLLFNSVTALAGASTVCFDPEGARRYAMVLDPFAALGRDHIAGFLSAYCHLVAQGSRDLQERTLRGWQDMLPQLETAGRVRGMTESMRGRFLCGALYSIGAFESQRDGDGALRVAARLDGLGSPLAVLAADQVRSIYYANQGNAQLSETFRVRVEHSAAQQGNGWQVETWAPASALSVALRSRDTMLMKRTAEQLARLTQQVASLDLTARRARGGYLMLRGDYQNALPWLEEMHVLEPRETVGWGRMCALLAQVYNELGQHDRALATCLRVYEHFDAVDFANWPSTLPVQTERLIAEAAQGQGPSALQRLDALIAQHALQRGPLTMGGLHEAGVRLGRLLGDRARELSHFIQMERWYLATDMPSLQQFCATQKRALQNEPGVRRGSMEDVGTSSAATARRLGQTVDRMLSGSHLSQEECARRALQILAEHTGTRSGLLFLLDDDTPRLVASLHGESLLTPELQRWLRARIESERADEETQQVELAQVESRDTVFEQAPWRCRALVLLDRRAAEHGVLGIAVVASDEGLPRPCPVEVSSAVGYHLQRAAERQRPA